MGGSRRALWLGLAAAATLLALVVGGAGWVLDPATLKLKLVAAAERATGRTLTISGPIGVKFSLPPTITMEDVALANPPGFSRPDMVKVHRVELGLALWPLFRHQFEVEHITLVRPDILFETGEAGRGNWLINRVVPDAAADAMPPRQAQVGPAAAGEVRREIARAGAPSLDRTPKRELSPLIKDISVVDGQIGWIDGAGHQSVVGIERLTLTEPNVRLAETSGTISFDGRLIRVTARTGSLEDLRSAFGAAPWPVAAKLESGDASITLGGTIAHPFAGRGYALTMDGEVPDPPAFAALLPRLPLASLRGVGFHAEVNDNGGANPAISALLVRLGAVDLDRFRHGARLEEVTLGARGTAPLNLSGRLLADGVDSRISGTVGDLAWLAGGRVAPVAVDLAWNAASAKASISGTIQQPRRLAGVALDVTASVPDPSQVLNGVPRALKAVSLRARLTDTSVPVPFELTSNAGDLRGELSVTLAPRLAVTGAIWSHRLDLDLLRGRVTEQGASIAPSTAAPAAEAARMPETAQASAVPASVPVVSTASRTPLLPDTKLPFGLLRAVDGGVRFNFGHVLFDGADVRRIDGMVTVKDGLLRLEPFSIAAISQRLSGILEVDASRSPPTIHLSVDAPGLALQPLLLALGLPPAASGSVAVRADLSGAGDSPRALAASLDGWAGAAVEDGQLDAQMVNGFLGSLRPLHIGGPDITDLRCFALRARATSGVVTIDPLAFDTPALIVEGHGDVDLGHETLALRLRPRTKIGGTGIALPVRVSGPLRDPSAKIDISPGGGAFAGLLLGGKDVMGAAGGGDPCPAALARAREGAGAAETPGARP